jgi:hypothetical protein
MGIDDFAVFHLKETAASCVAGGGAVADAAAAALRREMGDFQQRIRCASNSVLIAIQSQSM